MRTVIAIWGGLALLALLSAWHNQAAWTSDQAVWMNAIHIAPRHPRPCVNLGRAFFLKGQTDNARVAWEQAQLVASLPQRSHYERIYGWSAATTNLAMLNMRAAHAHDALRQLDQVLAVNPTFPEALRLRADIRWVVGNEDGASFDCERLRAYGDTAIARQESPGCW